MTRRQTWLSLACGLIFLLVSAPPTWGESYVELFIGGVHTENELIPFSILHPYANGVSAENLAVLGPIHLAINQSGTACFRLGTWFAKKASPRSTTLLGCVTSAVILILATTAWTTAPATGHRVHR